MSEWHPWMSDAACLDHDPDLFFPLPGDNHQAKRAKDVCAGCPVRDFCRVYADANDHTRQHGIFGGLTEKQRARRRRKP